MAIQRLTVTEVERTRTPGRYCDGGGLYLNVTPAGTRSWEFRYTQLGRTRYLGLGSLNDVTLAEARESAREARIVHRAGRDPVEERKAAKAANRISFDECFKQFFEAKSVEFKNPKHRQQWQNTLATYANPVFGQRPVGEIDTRLVMRVVEPIWRTKNETASRVRGRIETVLDWAKAKGHRTGENPARWAGHLEHLLANRSAVHTVKHHEALDYRDLPTFMAKLRTIGCRRGEDAIGPRALEFVILTGCRTGDLLGNDREDRPPMTWSEVNLSNESRRCDRVESGKLPARSWHIAQTKTSIEHFVPLSDRALAVLEEIKALGIGGDLVFPSLLKEGHH
jgi:integrase